MCKSLSEYIGLLESKCYIVSIVEPATANNKVKIRVLKPDNVLNVTYTDSLIKGFEMILKQEIEWGFYE